MVKRRHAINNTRIKSVGSTSFIFLLIISLLFSIRVENFHSVYRVSKEVKKQIATLITGRHYVLRPVSLFRTEFLVAIVIKRSTSPTRRSNNGSELIMAG